MKVKGADILVDRAIESGWTLEAFAVRAAAERNIAKMEAAGSGRSNRRYIKWNAICEECRARLEAK